MPDSFLHERSDFKALVATVADSEKINDPALVEKDYWITCKGNRPSRVPASGSPISTLRVALSSRMGRKGLSG
jgi:hypothetical protein